MTIFNHLLPSIEFLAKEELRPRTVIDISKLPSEEVAAVFTAIGEAGRRAVLYSRDEKYEQLKADLATERLRRKKKTEE